MPPGAALNYDVARSQVREQSLQLMAGETGGLALPPGAGVTSFMDRVLADEANRYSLAYVSPHGGDSRFHKIKVKVNRKGVELRHREGYIDRPRDVRVGDLVAGALLLGWSENPHRLEMEVVSQAPAENDEMAVTLRPAHSHRRAPPGPRRRAARSQARSLHPVQGRQGLARAPALRQLHGHAVAGADWPRRKASSTAPTCRCRWRRGRTRSRSAWWSRRRSAPRW